MNDITKRWPLMCCLLLCATLAFAAKRLEWTPEILIRILKAEKIQVEPSQVNALETARPLLRQIADNDNALVYFWAFVRRHNPPTPISGDRARELVRKGNIQDVSITHRYGLVLSTITGAAYQTEDSESESIRKVMHEVDPKGVFMSFGME